jgi:hypothetical protein
MKLRDFFAETQSRFLFPLLFKLPSMLVSFDHIACIIAHERRTAKRAYQGTRISRPRVGE